MASTPDVYSFADSPPEPEFRSMTAQEAARIILDRCGKRPLRNANAKPRTQLVSAAVMEASLSPVTQEELKSSIDLARAREAARKILERFSKPSL